LAAAACVVCLGYLAFESAGHACAFHGSASTPTMSSLADASDCSRSSIVASVCYGNGREGTARVNINRKSGSGCFVTSTATAINRTMPPQAIAFLSRSLCCLISSRCVTRKVTYPDILSSLRCLDPHCNIATSLLFKQLRVRVQLCRKHIIVPFVFGFCSQFTLMYYLWSWFFFGSWASTLTLP
jgi:hypothetical protein